MGKQIDRGFFHEDKIKAKNLACPPLSGFNHLAVYLRWAYSKNLIKDEVFREEPLLKPALEGEGDVRKVLSESFYLKGRILSDYFIEECEKFTEWFYVFNRDDKYPGYVDTVAEEYFGTEKYHSEEFQDEAYLFVPYDDEYYKNLSAYIEEAWNGKPPKLSGQSIGKEKLDDINETVRRETAVDAVIIKTENGEPGLFSSKIGGYPYWPADKEYPVDSRGVKLVLLAQINFADISFEKLPDKGILQFFIAFDDVLGLDEENGYKVVYHENPDMQVTEEDVKKLGIKSNLDLKEEFFMYPAYSTFPLSFSVQKDYIYSINDGFNEIANRVLKEKYGFKCTDPWSFLSKEDYNYLVKDEPECNHKMFGYSFFTQGDPRSSVELIEKYDTLLFQLDSEYNQENGGTEIGDGGVINFFINSKDLENRNFDDVLYYWDCY